MSALRLVTAPAPLASIEGDLRMQTIPDGEAGLLTPDEVSVRLQVKRSWVYAHASDLGGYRLGKYWRFNWTRVVEKLDRSAPGAPLNTQPNDQLFEVSHQSLSHPREHLGNKPLAARRVSDTIKSRGKGGSSERTEQ